MIVEELVGEDEIETGKLEKDPVQDAALTGRIGGLHFRMIQPRYAFQMFLVL